MTDAMLLAEALGDVLYTGAIGLILLGLYAMVVPRHLVRIVLGLLLVQSGVNLFLVAVGYRPEAAAPILLGGQAIGPVVDPLPQALVLTAIVIGVGVLALALALVVRVKDVHGTLDSREVAERMAAETGDSRLMPETAPGRGAAVPAREMLEDRS